MIEKTIVKSVEATGISPPNPSVIVDRFTNTTPTRQESPESSTSTLSGDDWIRLERAVRSAVKGQSSKDAQRLSRSLHHIAVQNQLLRYELEGLEEALVVKKNQEKPTEPLVLQQRQEYRGRSVVWSPRKVREARLRQSLKEREQKEQQLQKAETAGLKKAAQLYKLKIAEEKRVARQVAKVAREKEKAEKAEQVAARARQRAVQNAEKALRLSPKGKRKDSRPPTQHTKRRKLVVDAVGGGEASEALSPLTPVTTCRGRNVRFPDKRK